MIYGNFHENQAFFKHGTNFSLCLSHFAVKYFDLEESKHNKRFEIFEHYLWDDIIFLPHKFTTNTTLVLNNPERVDLPKTSRYVHKH